MPKFLEKSLFGWTKNTKNWEGYGTSSCIKLVSQISCPCSAKGFTVRSNWYCFFSYLPILFPSVVFLALLIHQKAYVLCDVAQCIGLDPFNYPMSPSKAINNAAVLCILGNMSLHSYSVIIIPFQSPFSSLSNTLCVLLFISSLFIFLWTLLF